MRVGFSRLALLLLMSGCSGLLNLPRSKDLGGDAELKVLPPGTVNETHSYPFAALIDKTITTTTNGSTPVLSYLWSVESVTGAGILPSQILISDPTAAEPVISFPQAPSDYSVILKLEVSNGTRTYTRRVKVPVVAVDDPPVIDSIAAIPSTPSEGQAVSLIATTLDLDSAELRYAWTVTNVSSANPGLTPASFTIFNASSSTPSFVAPSHSANYSVTLHLVVSDATNSVSQDKVIAVSASNAAPTIASVADLSTLEDTATSAIAVAVNDPDGSLGSLVLTGTSSNAALLPNANIVMGGSLGARTVVLTPALNASGTTTVTLSVTDGIATATTTFVLTVTAVNDAPTLSSISNLSIAENSATSALALTVADVDNAVGSLTVSAVSGNTALVPVSNIVMGGSGANRTVSVTPSAGAYGSALITLTVSDGTLSNSSSFTLTVTHANHAPTLTTISTLAGGSEDTAYTVTYAALLAASNLADVDVGDTLSFRVEAVSSGTLTKSGTAVTAGSTLLQTGESLVWTPASNANGTLGAFTVKGSDGSLLSATAVAVNVAVAAVNDLPTITSIANQTGSENTATSALTFTVGDVETAAGSLTMTATSTNTTMLPVANVVFGGSGAPRTVTLTPATNQSGTTTVKLTVADADGGTTDMSFSYTIAGVNHAPTLSTVATLSGGSEDTAYTVTYAALLAASNMADVDVGDTLSFRVEAVSTGTLNKGGTAVTAGTTLLSTGDSFVWTPAADANGTLNAFTVKAYDGALASTTAVQVAVSVAAVNDLPTITSIANQTGSENTATSALTFTVGDVETAPGSLTMTATSTNTTMLPVANVVFGGSGASRTVTLTPATNQSGTTTVKLTVTDADGGTTDISFSYSINVVNHAPTLSSVSTLPSATEDTNFTISYATLLAASNAADIDGDTLSFRVEAVSTGTLTKGGTAVTAGTTTLASGESLVWRAAQDANGTLNAFTVKAYDGALASATAVQVAVAVAAVNDLPTITSVANQTGSENTATSALTFTVGDVETLPTALTMTAASTNTTMLPVANVVFGGSAASRTVTLTPVTNKSGVATVTLTVTDADGGATDMSFTYTIAAVNHAPTLSTISALPSATEDTDFTISYATLLGVSNAADIDGDTISFRVEAVSSGTLTKGGTAVTAGTTTLASGESLVWRGAQDAFGTLNAFTVKAFDGALASATAVQVAVSVAAVNDAPVVSTVAAQSINQNATTGALTFTISDAETAASSLTVSATSSNTVLVPNANITLGGSNGSRTITVTPATNQYGTATITISVGDTVNTTTSTFTVTVAHVNQAPVLTSVTNLSTATEDTNFTISYATLLGASNASDSDGDIITFRIDAVSTGTLTKGGTAVTAGTTTLATGESLVWRGAQDANGTLAAFTVSATDGTLYSVSPVQVSVVTTAVNDLATISTIADQTINEDSNTGALAFTVGDVETAAASLTVSATSSNTTLVPNNPAYLTFGGSGASRTLTVTPAANQSGTSTITVSVNDGTASTTTTFALTVTAVNDAPTLTTVSTLSTANAGQAFSISYATLLAASNAADVDGPSILFRVEAVSTGTLTKGGTAVTAGTTTLASGETWVWTSAGGASGSTSAFTVKAYDGSLASATAVQVAVTVSAPTGVTVTNDLVLNFDASKNNGSSFTGAGCTPTTFTDMASALNGTLVNFSSCSATTGWYGTSASTTSPPALVFDGSDDEVTIAANSALELPSYTFETWVKRARFGVEETLMMYDNGAGGYNGGFIFTFSAANKVNLTRQDGSAMESIASTTTVSDTDVHHVAVTLDTATREASMYLDGVRVGGGTFNNYVSYVSGSSGFVMGRFHSHNYTGNPFKGSIYQARVYKRPLGSGEIMQNCVADKARYNGVACGTPAALTLADAAMSVNGSRVLRTAGGVAPYTYAVSSGGGSVDASTGLYTAPASAGSATVQVTDAASNTASATITIYAAVNPVTTNLGLHVDAARYNGTTFPATGCGTTTWSDLSGSSRNGTLVNFASCGATSGWNGTGVSSAPYRLQLDGTNDAVTIPDNYFSGLTSGAVEVWFKTSAYGALLGAQNSAVGGSPTWNAPVLYVGQDGRLRAQVWAGGYNVMTSSAGVNDGRWHQAVLSFTNAGQTLHLDGKKIASITPGTLAHSSGTKAQFGAATAAGTSWPSHPTTWTYFKGSIAVGRIYTQPITDAQASLNCFALRDRFDGVDCLPVTLPDASTAPSSTVTLAAVGGVSPYTYSLQSGAGSINSSTGVYTASASTGGAVVKVTDATGATATANVQVVYSVVAGAAFRYDAAKMNGTGFTSTLGCSDYNWVDLSGNGLTSYYSNSCSGANGGWQGVGTSASPYRLELVAADYGNVSVPYSAGYDTNNELTLEAWIKPTDVSSDQLIMSRDDTYYCNNGSCMAEWNFGVNAGNLYFRTFASDGYSAADTLTTPLSANVWSHVMVTFKAGNAIKLYVNGEPKANMTPTVALTSNNYDGMNIGSYYEGYGNNFNGAIAYAASYGTALSLSDVVRNCDANKVKFGATCFSLALAIKPAATITQIENTTYTMSASGGTAPYTFSIVSGGGSINASTGAFTAPAAPATVVVRVTDSAGTPATSNSTITVVSSATSASRCLATHQFAGGVGTLGDPYQVCTLAHWNLFMAGDWSKAYKLMANIDFTSFAFTSVGTFTGSFDGDYRKLSNISIAATGGNNLGFVKYLDGGTLKNLVLENVTVNAGSTNSVGAAVGRMKAGTISRVGVQGTSSVTGYDFTGGFVGQVDAGTISESFTLASVAGHDRTGGFTGQTLPQASPRADATFTNNYARGGVTGYTNIGGFVGYVYPAGASYANFSYNYAAGAVQTANTWGGFLGTSDGSSFTTTSLVYNSTLNAQGRGGGGFTTNGRTTAQQKDFTTFSAFNYDFRNQSGSGVWSLPQSSDYTLPNAYPILAWQDPTSTFYTQSYFAGGDGSSSTPYLLSSAQQFLNFARFRDFAGVYFKLTTDVDFASRVMPSIGSPENPFNGNFDGGSFKLSNIALASATDTPNVGFFRVVDSGGVAGRGVVKNLVLENFTVTAASSNYTGSVVGRLKAGTVTRVGVQGTSSVTGYDYTGGFVGYVDSGSVTESFTLATVVGHDRVGGFVGQVYPQATPRADATFTNDYARGNVSGYTNIGGFLGYAYPAGASYGNFSYSYASGQVQTSNTWGGFAGTTDGSSLTSVGLVYNSTLNSQGKGGGNLDLVGSSTTIMKRYTAFTGLGFDYGNQSEAGLWGMVQAADYGAAQVYPVLAWQDPASTFYTDNYFAGGDGSSATPYQVTTLQQFANLSRIKTTAGVYFQVTADLNFSGLTSPVIGSTLRPFRGNLDGQLHKISNLTIAQGSNAPNVGMFPVIDSAGVSANGVVKNLLVENIAVSSPNSNAVGGFIGRLKAGTISRVGVQGTSSVTGYDQTGGFVGYVDSGTIAESFTRATVAGHDRVGGFAGLIYPQATPRADATFTNDYARGNVSGYTNIGGFLGYAYPAGASYGNFAYSYASGQVQTSNTWGGFAGTTDGSSLTFAALVSNSTLNSQVKGGGGLTITGRTTTQMQTPSDTGWTNHNSSPPNSAPNLWRFTSSAYPVLNWEP